MKKSLVYLAVVGVMSAMSSIPVMAVPITITNHSFEDSDPLVNINSSGNWNTSVVGWNQSGVVGFSGGTFQPSTPGNFQGVNSFTQDVPDGLNTAWMSRGNLSQVLSATLIADTTYTLRADVGDRLQFPSPIHSLELRVAGIVLASASANPLDGQFDTASLSYSTITGDPFGANLEVWLVNNNGGIGPQLNWDNVRLDAVATAPVPEPSTILLLGSGLVGLIGFNYRRQKQAG